MKNKSGFTLVELLVVMAIIALLIGLGTEALIRLKASTEINETGRQTISYLNLVKNSAKNDFRLPSTPGNLTSQDGFRIEFTENDNSPLKITLCSQTAIGSNSQWDCVNNQTVENQLTLSDIPLVYENDTLAAGPTAKCKYVMFEFLTGDILIIPKGNSAISNPSNTTPCSLAFTEPSKRFKNYLVIDPLTDTYTIFSSKRDAENYRQN